MNPRGESDRYRESLATAGVTLLADNGQGDWRVAVPAGWANRTFFRLAESSDVVIRSLTPDDETLEEFVLRTVGA